MTTFGRPGYVRRALDAGRGGFVVKDTPPTQLADAVRRVHAGLRVIDPGLAAESLMAGPSPLTAREAEILAMALDGSPVATIAARAHLSRGHRPQPPVRRDRQDRREHPGRPGWDVHAVVAHTAHLEAVLAGAPEETVAIGEPSHARGCSAPTPSRASSPAGTAPPTS